MMEEEEEEEEEEGEEGLTSSLHHSLKMLKLIMPADFQTSFDFSSSDFSNFVAFLF